MEPAPTIAARDLPLASPWRRFAGFGIDWLLTGSVWERVLRTSPTEHPAAFFYRAVAFWAVLSAYHVISVARWGKTIGKLAVGTKVVGADGAPRVSVRGATLRWAPQFLATVISSGTALVVWAIAFLPMYLGVIRRPDRQGVHDRLAGTLVVFTR